MAVTVGTFRLSRQSVAVTDGKRHIQFDTPADMVDWLNRHPEVVADICHFDWTTQAVLGGH
jgi:hypothetical protein